MANDAERRSAASIQTLLALASTLLPWPVLAFLVRH
jgi:hypothetical protein